MKIIYILLAALLTGCSYTMTMAPRDGGGAYMGSVESKGGSGSVSVQLDNQKVCNGVFGKTYSSDTFGYLSAYGNRGSVSASGMTIGGADFYKVIMSCSDGTTIRCDVQGKSSGGGVCVDSKNKVYDLIYQ